jgi:hypothetical protein
VKRFSCFLFLGLCLSSSSWLLSQSTSATISGMVTDPAGKLISGANVTIVNDATNVNYAAETNGAGIYSTSVLPPGHYHIQVSKQGFKTLIKADIILNVQSAVALNFALPIGATSESITVEAGGLSINTTDATVSTVIDRNFVQNMPLNGRSLQSLLTLAPGVSQVAPPSSSPNGGVGLSGEIVVNGQRTEANYYTVDGVSANTGSQPGQFGAGAGVAGSVPGVTALGSTQSLVSIDALQEFRSSTSTYSAEYGRTPGGNFSFSTRSGSNALHGSIYDYFRNDALDATNWFNDYYGYPKGRERQNDFGGTIGGPLILPHLYNGRNKTFYFFSYEGLRLNSPQAATQVFVPDNTLRANAPASLQPLLQAFPVANYGLGTDINGFAYYIQAVSFPSSLDNTSGRIDHTIGEKLSLFARYADSPSSTTAYSAAVRTRMTVNNQGVTLGSSYALSPHQSNELRFNWTTNGGVLSSVSTDLGGAVPFDLGTLPGPNGSPFPQVGSSLYATFAFASFTNFSLDEQPTNQDQFNLTDSHSWIWGRHRFKAGMDWRHITTRMTPQYPNEEFEFTSESQVLSNHPAIAIATSAGLGTVEPRYVNISSYLQDEWKLSARLSVSLGLRWDINPAPTDANGPGPYTVTQTTDLATTALAPRGTPLWNTDWRGLAPRLGAAYQLHPGAQRNTVLRAGFGLFYDMGNTQGSYGYQGIGYAVTQNYTAASFPLTSAQIALPAPSVTAPYTSTVVGFDPNLKLPYSLQYNAAVEQQLGAHDTVTINFVGSGGRKLLTTFFTYPGVLGNSNFAARTLLDLVQGRASSSYNSLQVKYQRDLSQGLQSLVSYTWSHSIDDASSNFTIYKLLRADSDFDMRQTLQAAISYQAPRLRAASKWSDAVGGWAIDLRLQAQAGLPVNIVGSQQLNTSTGTYTQYQPNLVSGVPVYLYGSEYPGGKALNYAAFAAASAGIQGDVPRNFGHGFGAAQLDTALRREFPIRERLHLQLRAEAFNVLNHPMFGAIYSNLANGPALFGRAHNTLNGSLGGGLNSLYQLGGPRSLQLTLRMSF